MSIKTIKNVPQIDLFIDIFWQVGFFSNFGHTVFFAKFIDCFVILIDLFVVLLKKIGRFVFNLVFLGQIGRYIRLNLCRKNVLRMQ